MWNLQLDGKCNKLLLFNKMNTQQWSPHCVLLTRQTVDQSVITHTYKLLWYRLYSADVNQLKQPLHTQPQVLRDDTSEVKYSRCEFLRRCTNSRPSQCAQCAERSITKGASTYVLCFLHLGFVFTFNTSRQKRRGGHTGYTNTKLHSEGRRWKERADFCVIEYVEHKSSQAFVYVGPVSLSSTPTLPNKTLLYKFTPICTIRIDYTLFWHLTRGNLCI